jgi:hypothetical protein
MKPFVSYAKKRQRKLKENSIPLYDPDSQTGYSANRGMAIAKDIWREPTPERRIRKLVQKAKAHLSIVYPVRNWDEAEEVADRILAELNRLRVHHRWGGHGGGDYCVIFGEHEHAVFIEVNGVKYDY